MYSVVNFRKLLFYNGKVGFWPTASRYRSPPKKKAHQRWALFDAMPCGYPLLFIAHLRFDKITDRTGRGCFLLRVFQGLYSLLLIFEVLSLDRQ